MGKMEDGQQLQSPSFSLLATGQIFCLQVNLERTINFVHEILRMKYMPPENFRDEIFSSENALTKLFHTDYLELKLTRMKIKRITVNAPLPHTLYERNTIYRIYGPGMIR